MINFRVTKEVKKKLISLSLIKQKVLDTKAKLNKKKNAVKIADLNKI